MINISEAYIEFQDYIKNDIINPIPRGGLWYNLFHGGGMDNLAIGSSYKTN